MKVHLQRKECKEQTHKATARYAKSSKLLEQFVARGGNVT